MKILGVVCHSVNSVREQAEERYSSVTEYPDLTGKVIIAETMLRAAMAIAKLRKKGDLNRFVLCVDLPSELIFNGIPIVGGVYLGKGLYVREPKILFDTTGVSELDTRLLGVQLTIKAARKHLK